MCTNADFYAKLSPFGEEEERDRERTFLLQKSNRGTPRFILILRRRASTSLPPLHNVRTRHKSLSAKTLAAIHVIAMTEHRVNQHPSLSPPHFSRRQTVCTHFFIHRREKIRGKYRAQILEISHPHPCDVSS